MILSDSSPLCTLWPLIVDNEYASHSSRSPPHIKSERATFTLKQSVILFILDNWRLNPATISLSTSLSLSYITRYYITFYSWQKFTRLSLNWKKNSYLSFLNSWISLNSSSFAITLLSQERARSCSVGAMVRAEWIKSICLTWPKVSP